MSSVSSSTSSNSYYYAMQKKMFDKLDTDANGTVDENELLAGKPKTMTKDQASQLYTSLDSNQSGGVTQDEFAAGTQTGPGMGLISQLPSDALDVLLSLQQGGLASAAGGGGGSGGQSDSDAAFDALDTNKDGVVSEEEFLAAHPEQVNDEEAKKLFETVDADKDGNIDQDQFKQITDATTPPRLMGPAYFGLDAQTGDDGSGLGGISALFGSVGGGHNGNNVLRLFDLLESESEGTTTSAA